MFNDNKEFRGGKPLIFTRVSNPWLEKHTTSLETGRLKVTGRKNCGFFSHKEHTIDLIPASYYWHFGF